jgi:hypothetical protein
MTEVIRNEQTDFEEARAGVEQAGDAFARGELAGAMLLLDFGRAAAFAEFVFEVTERLDEMTHVSRARDGLRGGGIFGHRRLV